MNMEDTQDLFDTISKLGNVYINDAFGSAHRDHLSINGFNYNTCGYGYLIQEELKALKLITQNPYKQNTLAIIGGGKMDDKLAMLKNLSQKVDTIYITGGNINSIIKLEMSTFIDEISSNKAKIVLMEDGLSACNFQDFPVLKQTSALNKDDNEYFYDIGVKSLNTLQELIHNHSIIFWNGTLGVVEEDKYATGSTLCVKMLQDSININPNRKIIIGGGDTGGFVEKFKHNFTHISTGGGASIEYISFNNLVGLNKFNI
jgi:phosphoglycerate kinase